MFTDPAGDAEWAAVAESQVITVSFDVSEHNSKSHPVFTGLFSVSPLRSLRIQNAEIRHAPWFARVCPALRLSRAGTQRPGLVTARPAGGTRPRRAGAGTFGLRKGARWPSWCWCCGCSPPEPGSTCCLPAAWAARAPAQRRPRRAADPRHQRPPSHSAATATANAAATAANAATRKRRRHRRYGGANRRRLALAPRRAAGGPGALGPALAGRGPPGAGPTRRPVAGGVRPPDRGRHRARLLAWFHAGPQPRAGLDRIRPGGSHGLCGAGLVHGQHPRRPPGRSQPGPRRPSSAAWPRCTAAPRPSPSHWPRSPPWSSRARPSATSATRVRP